MRSRKDILFVCSSLSMGGPQKSLIGLLERLDPESFNVSLLVLNPDLDELREYIPAHVSVLPTARAIQAATLPRAQLASSLCTLFPLFLPGRLLSFVKLMIRGLRGGRGWQQIRQQVWRLLHTRLPRVDGRYDAAFGILGLSTYAMVDLVDATHKYHWVRSDSRILDRDADVEGSYFDRLDGALAVSKLCADIFEEMYPNARGRVAVYKNSIPRLPESSATAVGRFDVRPNRFRLLTVSRLDPLKGIDLAVLAAGRLKRRGYDFEWVVLGEGPERGRLESLIEEEGVEDVISLRGTVLNTAGYLEASHIYVHPSRAEGRSNAVEEARAAGRVIVATAYPTVRDQVRHMETGLVCALDPESLADAVEILIHNAGLRKRLSEKARSEYESEDIDANEYFQLLASGQIDRVVELSCDE